MHLKKKIAAAFCFGGNAMLGIAFLTGLFC